MLALAASQPKPILLCDRGVMDAKAYVKPAEWQILMDQHELNQTSLRDLRYDCVLHLVTAAKGAEAFYTLENNPARFENAEMARDADQRTLDAWTGHPHLRVLDNSTDFAGKVNRVLKAI